MKKLIALTSAALMGLGLVTAASAHHAVNAQFDIDKEAQITGTLAKLDTVQPHSFWYFVVKNPNGTPLVWAMIGLWVLHVVGAIKHQFDGAPVLWRMIPFFKRP